VAFDGWYASPPNLKLLRSFDWAWVTRLKENCLVNPDGTYCYHKGISWFEAKTSIIREAVRAYLAKPLYTLNPTA
jgi:hypothetical protein